MYLCVHAHIRARGERVCAYVCLCMINVQLPSECKEAMSEMMGCQKQIIFHF